METAFIKNKLARAMRHFVIVNNLYLRVLYGIKFKIKHYELILYLSGNINGVAQKYKVTNQA